MSFKKVGAYLFLQRWKYVYDVLSEWSKLWNSRCKSFRVNIFGHKYMENERIYINLFSLANCKMNWIGRKEGRFFCTLYNSILLKMTIIY